MKKLFLYSLAALLLWSGSAGYAQTAAGGQAGTGPGESREILAERIGAYAEYVRDQWRIPGMAVAFMQDGELILAKGFGTKETGRQDPVDARTVFQVGSVSKSFTATVMASLVDEGKVKWDDTVKNILPDFEMYDPWVTENMQVKDIMIHRSGLREQAGTYIPNLGYGREDIYRMLPLMNPYTGFISGSIR